MRLASCTANAESLVPSARIRATNGSEFPRGCVITPFGCGPAALREAAYYRLNPEGVIPEAGTEGEPPLNPSSGRRGLGISTSLDILSRVGEAKGEEQECVSRLRDHATHYRAPHATRRHRFER